MSISKTIRLANGLVVTDQGILRRDIILRAGHVDLSGKELSCDEIIDVSDRLILPGFVDIHFHGFSLFDFTSGLYDPKGQEFDHSSSAFQFGFDMLSKELPRFGVTGCYVASLAAPVKVLRRCYGELSKYLTQIPERPEGARIFGGLLEGSFINPQMAGAQNPAFVLEFSKEAFDSIEDNESVKLANVVPDFGKPSVQLTEYLTEKGIVVGAGHTNATFKQFTEAVRAGLKYCIHFTNGPTGGSYKAFEGGGAVEAVLKLDELSAELIADGYHVSPGYVRDIIKRKHTRRVIGITDAVFATGSDLKEFNMAGVKGRISEDRRYVSVASQTDTLGGSLLTMNKAFENMLNWLTDDLDGIWNHRHQAFSLEQGVTAAAKIYSTNPCTLTGLSTQGFGRIADGAKADLCVLDIVGSGGTYKVTVDLTIVGGNVVYSKN